MSKTKAKIFVFIILALAGLMFFGCEQKPIVEDINFLDDEINLLVGERFTPTVEVYPTYSSDYYLISSDENIVKINGKEIEAISQGNALIKVRATQNEAIESAINVTVLNEPSKIKTPSLSFNEATQQIYISPVPYANDYTLVVNENEFNVAETQIDLQGLVNRFSADLLTLKVKANAAAGSKVFESSDWSGEYCVFAISNASIKAGKLSFDVRDDVNYIISLDDETLPTLTLQDGVDLTALDPKFAGKNVNVKIAGEFKTKSEGVTYFGNSINLPLNVLPAFSAQFSGNVISWADADVNFNITIKNLGSVFETATAENNSFNLTNLTKFNLIEAEAVYTVLVEPVVDEFVFNTATTETKIEVEFSKKAAPVLSTLNNTILWDGTDNYEINGKTTTTVSSANQIKFDGKESGQYVVTVSAMAGQDNGIYYLASDNAQIEITKQAEVSLTYANLKDHVLTFDSEAEDEYLVYIDDIAHTITSGENKENKFSVNFKTFKDFYIASGRHTIYVKHLGKPMGEGQACFDSEPSGIAFTQLEEILNINMAEQTASVEKTLVNQSAQISFVVSDGENTKTYDGDSVYIDTDDEFYQTKTYSICVKVEGDGVHTFSVFNDAMAKREFTVLDCPTLKVLDAATMQVNFDAISNAYGYNITLNGGEFKNNFTNNYFNIEIYEGQTLNFAARTVPQLNITASKAN